jgi:hypothetical protein
MRRKRIPEVKAATLPRLVELLTDIHYSTSRFRKVFLLTLRTFTTPTELLYQLIQQYYAWGGVERKQCVIHLLCEWMWYYYEDDWEESDEFIRILSTFLIDLKHFNDFHFSHSKILNDRLRLAPNLHSLSSLTSHHQTDISHLHPDVLLYEFFHHNDLPSDLQNKLSSPTSSTRSAPNVNVPSKTHINNTSNTQSSPNFTVSSNPTASASASASSTTTTTTNNNTTQLPDIKEWYTQESSSCDIWSVSDIEMADTLTFITSRIYSQLKERELLAWVTGESNHTTVDNLIEIFNRISIWISYEIVTRLFLKDRIILIEKFIRVAVILEERNNFHCLMALLSGLNLSSVWRLRRTFENVSSSSLSLLQSL